MASLAVELEREVRGEVRFDTPSRALYATDSSNYRMVPIGVVVPRTLDDVLATVAACAARRVPVLSRGGGTALAGQTCNEAVVLDFSKHLNRVLEIDAGSRTARVQPGLVLDDLRRTVAPHGLTYGPDPATHDRCTLGGMIGNNSCGVHSVMAGKTADNVSELDVLLYDGTRLRVGRLGDAGLPGAGRRPGREGEVYRALDRIVRRWGDDVRSRFPKIPRRVSGYALDRLLPEHGVDVAKALVGSEGTCVTVLEATVNLVANPSHRALAVIGFADVFAACDAVPAILEAGPIGLEGFDRRLVAGMRRQHLETGDLELLPEGEGWLLVEFGADDRAAAERAADSLLRMGGWKQARRLSEPEAMARLWKVRESALGATARVPGQPPTHPGWEDSAVAPDRLAGYLRDLAGLIEGYGYERAFYGHFGDGCVHTRIDFDLESAAGVRRFRSFIEDAADVVVAHGGSLSGEHGDGQARGELLVKMFGAEVVDAFRAFRSAWDPLGRMNPGKVVDALPLDSFLRPARGLPEPRTHFSFAAEGGFGGAAGRCVGVGKCRRHGGGTMCPSYMVTREEKHSTRGRARLLYEMLDGRVLADGWRDEGVREALDLCLACKGCKGECPVSVDMATYKAEFLAHYYEGRLRPRAAYSMGMIGRWTPWLGRVPHAVNLAARLPGAGAAAKAIAGIDRRRALPAFAPRSFRGWFESRSGPPRRGRRVLLWPDTFNNHFHPSTGAAAVSVLEAMGYRVELPPAGLCCGRPLYDWGLLDRARDRLESVLHALAPWLDEDVEVVGLEPSCVSVFRDELRNLFPDDDRAARLADATHLLGEFVARHADEVDWPGVEGSILLHRHCHQAALDMNGDAEVLRRAGLEVEVLDSGCCGMAGAFGFEPGHYDVSVAAGERVLLPRVRSAPPGTLLVSDGFSCRTQVEQLAGRPTLHSAQALAQALSGSRPAPEPHALRGGPTRTELGLLAGGAMLLGAAVASWSGRRSGG